MLRRAVAVAVAAALAACKNPQPCPEPLQECDGQCVDVQTDRRHCATCRHDCRAGEVCGAATCNPDVRAPCAIRTGGAFVTFEACGGSVKTWVRQADFVDEAVASLGSTATGRVPVLTVRPGADCDLQWSWQVDDADPTFQATVSVAGCNVCPNVIQTNPPAFALVPGKWCPGAAQIVAVDRR